MQRTYESARALVNCAAGPLARHIDPFITSLIEQQYRPSVIYIKARHGLAFDRWLTKRRITLADLCDAQIVQYQNRTRRRHQRIRAETRRIEWKALTQLLQFLRVRVLVPKPTLRRLRLRIQRLSSDNIFKISKDSQPQRSSATAASPSSFSAIVSGAARWIYACYAPAMQLRS